MLDLCDRILCLLSDNFGMTAREIQRRLGGDFPFWALGRLIDEGFVAVEAPVKGGLPRYRFAFGAKWAWDAMIFEVRSAIENSGRPWTIEALAAGSWSRPGWLVRAVYRLWRFGRIERRVGAGYSRPRLGTRPAKMS